ncbi:MAG: nucleotide exchange factor GrpE [Rhodothermales bacterium]
MSKDVNREVEPSNIDSPNKEGGQESENYLEEIRGDITEQMHDNDDAADIALAAVDELADRAAELETLKQDLNETREQLLRKAAEFQNYRRRIEAEKSQLVELGKAVVIQQLLDVLDDLGRTLEAAEQIEEREHEGGHAYRALRDGVELVYKKFLDELARQGVEPIEAEGRPFNENEHEAMMQRQEEGVEPGTVVAEIQKGYRMGDRVLRHSKVVVSV